MYSDKARYDETPMNYKGKKTKISDKDEFRK